MRPLTVKIVRGIVAAVLTISPAWAIVDSNANGMSDVWERHYNSGNLFSASNPLHAQNADPDGDGWSNAKEAISGTNPFSNVIPAGLVQAKVVQQPNIAGVFLVSWPSVAGKKYSLKVSDDLVTWADFGEVIEGTGQEIQIAIAASDEEGEIPSKLFWRVKIEDEDPDGDTLSSWEELALGTNPNHADSDLDGIPDNLDTNPLVSATLADPDGTNPPTGSTTNLRGFWDFESASGTPLKFPDRSGANRHATSFSGAPQPFGIPSQAGKISPGYITVPASTFQGQNTWTISGWLKFAKDGIKNASTGYKVVYALYDLQGSGPSPQLAPLAQGTILAVAKVGTTETWYVGGYQQTVYFNEAPNANGNPKTVFNGHSFTLPLGTTDDGDWHHFAVTRSSTANGQKVYFDGALAFQGALLDYPVSYDADTTLTLGRLHPAHTPSALPEAYVDRLRVNSRLLNATEVGALYHQDIDGDSLWDLTESKTNLWRDANSDGLAATAEYSFISSPFVWQPATNDTDGDEGTDLEEQTAGTDIGKADTDGDLIPDGWEMHHGLNPLSPTDATLDPDNDGLNNLKEWQYNTNPQSANSDGGDPSHPDNVNDGTEVNNGSDPNDPTDGGQAPQPGEAFTVHLGVGDQSGSESEDYILNCFKLDRSTGEEKRIYTLRSGGFGQYKEEDSSLFRKGESYSFQIHWQGSKLTSRTASPGVSAEGPDFDYTLKVEPQGSNLGNLVIDSWDSSTGQLATGSPIRAVGASDVATDPAEFRSEYEKKRVILLSSDIDVDSDNNNGTNLPDRTKAEEKIEDYASAQLPANQNPGKYIKTSTGDCDNDGIPDFADGMDVYGGFGSGKCYRFTPMVVDLGALKKLQGAKFKLDYDFASPNDIVNESAPSDGPKWGPGNGTLRVWKKDGIVARRAADIKDGGDLIRPGVSYTAKDFGSAASNGSVTLYVEAVRKSSSAGDRPISLYLSADGSSWQKTGAVRLTAIPRVVLKDVDQVFTPLPGSKIKVTYEDGTDATGSDLGGTLTGNGNTLIVGKYGPHPNGDSDETKDQESLVINLQTGASTYTAPADGITLLVAQGWDENPPVLGLTSEGDPGEEFSLPPEPQVPTADNYPPEADGPEEWEDAFERILFEKYEEADPRIEDLERDAFELWGWTYGGRDYKWFSNRNVWRDGSHIFVEDSLTPEQAANRYYAFLKQAIHPAEGQPTLIPILREYADTWEALGEDRAKIGQHMAKHWDLVETTAGLLESEYMFVTADFAIGGVMQIRRVRNLTFFTEGKTFAVPLVRRNWARGNITEHDTLVNSLGYSRNAGQGALRLTAQIDGQAVTCIPDAVRPHWFLEVKDWKSLSLTRQIRAEFASSAAQSKRLCIVVTGRTRRISRPLFDTVKESGGLLVRRNLNTDTFEFWDHWDTNTWQAIDKATLQQFLSNP